MQKADLQINISEFLGPELAGLRNKAAALALVGLILTGIGILTTRTGDPGDSFISPAVWHSLLWAWILVLGFSTGSLMLLLVHHVTGGGWGYILRRSLEAGVKLLPVMLVLFLAWAVLGGLEQTYVWVNPSRAHEIGVFQFIPPSVLHMKEVYLNPKFFVLRTAVYFFIWIIIGWSVIRLGDTQDTRSDLPTYGKLNRWGAGGIVVYVFTATFASVDWIQSMTPGWISSIFGFLLVISQMLTAMALLLILIGLLAGNKPLVRQIPEGYFRDLGNLMLALVMGWAYLAFSQYMLQFTGNLTDEVRWYVYRAHGEWGAIGLFLMAFHFAFPFVLLLVASPMKKDPRRLWKIAALLLVMRAVDVFWWVTPTFSRNLTVGWADLGAPLLLGGIWLYGWASLVGSKPLVPVYDPRLEAHLHEVVAHHG